MITPQTQADLIVTELEKGELDAKGRLFALVYEELCSLADYLMQRERAQHTLQPTALVHEAYIKILGSTNLNLQSRAQFRTIAARAMRQFLIDHSRHKNAAKRGRDWHRVTLEGALIDSSDQELDLYDLARALEKLSQLDENQALIVDLRFFAGMSMEEISETQAIPYNQVRKEWTMARAFLTRELGALH